MSVQWRRCGPCRPGDAGRLHGSRGPLNLQDTKFFVGYFGLNSVLLTEESTLRDLGVTSLISMAGTPTGYLHHCDCSLKRTNASFVLS
jgi:hypothetical protein